MSEAVNSEKTDVVAILLIHEGDQVRSILIYINLVPTTLTLAKLHVSALTSFIKLIKLLENLMKLLPNHIMF